MKLCASPEMNEPHADLVQPVPFLERNTLEPRLPYLDERFNDFVHEAVVRRTEPARLLYRLWFTGVELKRERIDVMRLGDALILTAYRAWTAGAWIKSKSCRGNPQAPARNATLVRLPGLRPRFGGEHGALTRRQRLRHPLAVVIEAFAIADRQDIARVTLHEFEPRVHPDSPCLAESMGTGRITRREAGPNGGRQLVHHVQRNEEANMLVGAAVAREIAGPSCEALELAGGTTPPASLVRITGHYRNHRRRNRRCPCRSRPTRYSRPGSRRPAQGPLPGVADLAWITLRGIPTGACGGVPVYDADAAVHQLYEGEAAPAIEAAFPGTTANGKVDRPLARKCTATLADRVALVERRVGCCSISAI